MSELEMYETAQPWITWTYFRPDWWTRVFGKTQIKALCCICGERETLDIPMPRFGPVPPPPSGRHAERIRFCDAHVHTLKRRAPETWALPLRNLAALSAADTLDIFRDVAERSVRQEGGHIGGRWVQNDFHD